MVGLGRTGRLTSIALVALTLGGAALFTAGFAVGRSTAIHMWPLKHDQVGYYAFLPSLFLHGDLSFEGLEGPDWEAFEFTGFRRSESTGRLVNMYTPGVAVLQVPFFLAGHALAFVSRQPRDGLSGPYRFLTGLGGVFYAGLGLFLVTLALRPYFDDWVIASVLVALGAGTNLTYYAALEPLMSHAYSFFAFGAVLWGTLTWRRTGDGQAALFAGAALGLAVLIRPTNAVLALLPAGVALPVLLGRRPKDADGVSCGCEEGWDAARHWAAAAALAALFVAPLLLYWRWAAGSWLYNPHGAGTFYWSEPALASVLFSYRKGWFVYTPVMLALVPGLLVLRRFLRGYALPLAGYLAVNLYVVAAWWAWWYGGSFGMRALIEVGAVAAPALAALLAWAGARVRVRRGLLAGLALLVALNLFQTYQYVMTYIRWDGMTSASYWAVFGRPTLDAEERARAEALMDVELPRLPRG